MIQLVRKYHHANTMKLIAELCIHGIMDLDPQDQKILAAIYHLPLSELEQFHFHLFCHILYRTKAHPEAKLAFIMLIGDTFSDRVGNDIFTFPVLVWLQINNIAWST